MQRVRNKASYKNQIIKCKQYYPHICYYCNKILLDNEITIDHLIPLSRGGKTTLDNLRIACKKCNNEKGNMTEQEYYTYLKNKNKIACNINNNIRLKIKTCQHIKLKHYDVDTYMNIENIVISNLFLQHPVTKKKIDKVTTYYKYFHCLDEPITIRRQNNLLINGYARYIFAKEHSINQVPVVYDSIES